MNLGENVFQLRTAQNRSQTELADLLGVSRQSVSKWENNTAIPDLERLINMSHIFSVTLDELVFGPPKKEPEPSPSPQLQAEATTIINQHPPVRVLVGLCMLVFGMIFFLLSIFWGNHLAFGEAFGELTSAVIVLLSLSLVATDHREVMAVCAIIIFCYAMVAFGFMHVTSFTSYAFIGISSLIILIWFIVAGLRDTPKV